VSLAAGTDGIKAAWLVETLSVKQVPQYRKGQ